MERILWPKIVIFIYLELNRGGIKINIWRSLIIKKSLKKLKLKIITTKIITIAIIKFFQYNLTVLILTYIFLLNIYLYIKKIIKK